MSIGHCQILDAVVVLQREIGEVDGYTEERVSEVPVVGAVDQEIAGAEIVLSRNLVVDAGVDLIRILHLYWRRNELVGTDVRPRNQRQELRRVGSILVTVPAVPKFPARCASDGTVAIWV